MVFDRRETLILLIGDFLILIASLWTALLLRNLSFPATSYFQTNLIPFLPIFLLSIVVFYIAGLYEKQTRPIRRLMGMRIFGAQAATVAMASILFFVLPFSIAPKTILVLYLIVSVAAESAWRFYRMNREKTEENRVPALFVGTGLAHQELVEEIKNNDWYLIRCISQIDTCAATEESLVASITAGINEGARVIVLDTANAMLMQALVKSRALVMAHTVTIKDAALLYEEIFDRVSLESVPMASLFESLSKQHQLYDGLKRVFDIVLALCGSVIAIPIVTLAALALLLESGMPFFRHERIGKGGQHFSILKLRSMLLNDHGDPELQRKNRVTPIGRLIRKTRIDELPQLWNVLTGDLSFIGPRPELPKIAEVYEQEIPQYWMRHLITPGLSGWAQIHDYDAPRGPADVVRTRRKLAYDLYYLKHRSFSLDVAIAVKTIRALLSLSGT